MKHAPKRNRVFKVTSADLRAITESALLYRRSTSRFPETTTYLSAFSQGILYALRSITAANRFNQIVSTGKVRR